VGCQKVLLPTNDVMGIVHQQTIVKIFKTHDGKRRLI